MKKLQYLIMLLLISAYFPSCSSDRSQENSPETALFNYINKTDEFYSWKVTDTNEQEGHKIVNLVLNSQKWQGMQWKHRVSLIIPEKLNSDIAMLFITGGRNKDGEPQKRGHEEKFLASLAAIANSNNAMVAVLWQVPNQPLFDGLVEDEIISLTLHKFRETTDYEWPLLFPMVKSVVRAMDAVQEYTSNEQGSMIRGFLLTGASKRGWTSWLTAAADQRVEAIAPMVIDVLNMPRNLQYQIDVWGDYSIQIQDYVDLELPQSFSTDTGKMITDMVDPYSYREKLDMPKLIFIGTNDEYWPADAVKHYFDSLPGENYLHYVPNAGHGLGDGMEARRALSAFFYKTINGKFYNSISWEAIEKGENILLKVLTDTTELVGASLWATVSADRDLRDSRWEPEIQELKLINDKIELSIALPDSGYKAFYLDLSYKTEHTGLEYSKSTRLFVSDKNGLL